MSRCTDKSPSFSSIADRQYFVPCYVAFSNFHCGSILEADHEVRYGVAELQNHGS